MPPLSHPNTVPRPISTDLLQPLRLPCLRTLTTLLGSQLAVVLTLEFGTLRSLPTIPTTLVTPARLQPPTSLRATPACLPYPHQRQALHLTKRILPHVNTHGKRIVHSVLMHAPMKRLGSRRVIY